VPANEKALSGTSPQAWCRTWLLNQVLNERLKEQELSPRQLDTFTLPDMRVWGIEALEHLTPTRSHMTIKLNTAWLQLWGFWFLGSSDLPSIPTSDRSPQSP